MWCMCIDMNRQDVNSFLKISLVVILYYCPLLYADTLESLVMPGPVIEGHKKYEKTCKKCHSVFSKKNQNMLCRDCHKKVSADIKEKRGYHGRLTNNTICQNCHTEHTGRNSDIVKLNEKMFNHDKTDFKLRGRHREVACNQCHKKGKKYREASSNCVSCHKKQNPHDVDKLVLGKSKLVCNACHHQDGWDTMVFRHEKTKFRLTGKHESVKCINCHPNDHYSKTPKNCYACHKFDDVHKREKGKKCEKCHNPRGWRSLKFDHDKETKFPLKGRHKKLQCGDCHKKDPYEFKIKKVCYTCHKADDHHAGRFGKKCDKCHGFKKWDKVKFKHDVDTKFKLKGGHKKIKCEACHTRNAYEHETDKACYSCHKKDDVHKRQQGKACDDCHNESSWRKKVIFDHDLTKFPLLGLHAALACEECHLSNQYKDVGRKCIDCHKKDDEHTGRLGPDCQVCHNPNSWRVWSFDHDRQTNFKLDGKHRKLHCHDCHKIPVSNMKNQLGACNDCHAADDIHNGQFGRDCARCHSTKTFKNAKLPR